jgi:RNA polymerase sigma-70 factor (ECF subfamily)
MKGVCLRYSSNAEEAKDILQESFIKVFSKIHSFSNKGSLEGWIRRIVINTAINHFNRNKKFNHDNIDDLNTYSNIMDGEEYDHLEVISNDEDSLLSNLNFSETELIGAINSLPESFRLVFNLFYIENHSHKDISELLSIEENTSRSRLFRAKKILQKHLYTLRKPFQKEVLNKGFN